MRKENELLIEMKLNPIVRFLLYPIGTANVKNELARYYESGENKKLLQFKNIHAGERCFIIGNGPSLTTHDLDLLKNERTFGLNSVYRLFDKTVWRPTYYVASDKGFIANYFDEIADIECEMKFIDMRFMDQKSRLENCAFICTNPKYIINNYNLKPQIHEDITEYMERGGTVTFDAIQIAIYMGFREIYLIGQDFSMPFYKDRYGFPHRTDEKHAHFAGGDNVKVHYLNRQSVLNAFLETKDYCAEHGIIIKNATRGGKLEVFERADLEDILESQEKR